MLRNISNTEKAISTYLGGIEVPSSTNQIFRNLKIVDIEGVDNSGKTTQCNMLHNMVKSRGMLSCIVKELDATEYSREIRRRLIAENLSKEAEARIFLENKEYVYHHRISPAIDAGYYIIKDRGLGSYLTYHKLTLKRNRGIVNDLMNFLRNSEMAGTTFFLDIPIDEAMDRLEQLQNKSKFDLLGKDFFNRQRDSFLQIAELLPNRKIIDGTQSRDAIHKQIVEEIYPLLNKK